MLLILCVSSLALELVSFTDAKWTAHRNANHMWKTPWTSSVQTYQMKIGELSCSVFMVSPTVGITAAHCFREIVFALPTFQSPTAAFPSLIRTHLTGSVIAADSTREISKIKAAFVRSLYFEDYRRLQRNSQQNTRLPIGDFAYIRVNPKIDIHEAVRFASGHTLYSTEGVAAGCKCLADGNPEPRSCIMELTRAYNEYLEMDGTCLAHISMGEGNPSHFIMGFSGGPVTVRDANGKEFVVGYTVGDSNILANPYHPRFVIVNRLDEYVPLIKDLIVADEATSTDQPIGDVREVVKQKLLARQRVAWYNRAHFIEIVFPPLPTTPNPIPPSARNPTVAARYNPTTRTVN